MRDQNGTLYIHQARFEDAGEYTCVAFSEQGIINATIKVIVAGNILFISFQSCFRCCLSPLCQNHLLCLEFQGPPKK